jgi:hypothetical protein
MTRARRLILIEKLKALTTSPEPCEAYLARLMYDRLIGMLKHKLRGYNTGYTINTRGTKVDTIA